MKTIFNRDVLITTFIPFALLYLPAYFVATHYVGEWAFMLILYGYLMYGAMMLWAGYYELQKASKSLRQTLSTLSDKEIDTAAAAYVKYIDPEAAEVVMEQVAKFRKEAGR